MSDIILITGGSGFVGIKIIATALMAGYSARAAARNQARASAIRAAASIQA
jgi:uncharacterized protein YbjT (DUF2867 family)